MNKKNIVVIVLFIIVMVLCTFGIKSYLKTNTIDIKFGIGKIGKQEEETGKYVKCTRNLSSLTETVYFEFRNNKLYNIGQVKYEGKFTDENIESLKKEHPDYKKYVEDYLLGRICVFDEKAPLCGNLKYTWNGNNIVITFALDVILSSDGDYNESTTPDELISKISTDTYTTCSKVDSAPIYSKKLDPKGTYYSKMKK